MRATIDPSTWQVLIIDDEPDNLNLVSDFLGFGGAKTITANSGQVALDIVCEFNPNLILLDLQMPDMDGWETHRHLRAKPELNDVPIIALTARAMLTDADKVRSAGFDGYITKPFRVATLLTAVMQCIQNFRGPLTTLAKES